MATLAEVASRIPQATAEITGKKLGSVIDTVKDTLNPANFFQAAGSILQQEAPIFGMVGDVIGDFAGSLFGGTSPESETASNTEDTKENTEESSVTLENLNVKIDALNQEQIRTTNALLGNQPILSELSEAQQTSNELTEQGLLDAQQKEIANLEMMRESSRKEDDVIQLQEEDKEDNDILQAIMGTISGGISGLLNFFTTSFMSLLTGGLGTLLKGVVGVGGGLASGAAKAATGVAGLATKGIAAAGGLLPAAGIAVAGASLISGLFSGVTAGLEEYQQSGELGSAIKEGTAGFVSGATFGLISQETVSETFDTIGNFASESFENIKNVTSSVFESFPTFEQVTNSITETGASIKNNFENFTGIEVPTFDNVGGIITNTVGDAVGSVESIFSGDFSLETFGTLFGSLTDIVYAPVNLAVNAVKDIFSLGDPEEPFSLSEFISGFISDVFDYIKNLLPNITDIIPDIPDLSFGLFGGDEEAQPQLTREQAQMNARMRRRGELGGLPEENINTKSTGGGFLDFFRREGGPVEAGSNYLVGEEGPELFFPNVSGSVVNNDETNQLLSRMQTVNNLTRTVEMLASQTVISDMTAEGTAAGGGQTVIAPQTNNNVTNNNMAAQKPTPRNVEPTISRLASMDYYFATP